MRVLLLTDELAASGLNLPETRDLPPQLPGSPPGIGVQESGLRCTACSGAIGGRMAGLEEVNRKLL